jgi:hypothetical protein
MAPKVLFIGMPEFTTCYAYHPVEQRHNLPDHVENNRRTAAIMALLRERGLLDEMLHAPVSPITA